MAKRGYDLTSGNLYSKANVNPWAAYTMALRTKANGQLGDKWYHYQDEQDTPDEQRALLGTKYEIKIAIDDFDCRQTTDYMNRYETAQVGLEQAFVNKHRKQLDAMLAFAEQYGPEG